MVLLSAGFVFLLAPLRAQVQPVPIPLNAGPLFGMVGSNFIGDVDGDGVDDFIVGEPASPPGAPPSTMPAHLWVISGATLGAVSDYPSSTPGGVIGVGDVDGDGDPDIMTRAAIHDALTGTIVTPLTAFSGLTIAIGVGVWFGGIGDVNGDGRSDLGFIGGYTDPVTGGMTIGLQVYDGFGSFLYTIPLSFSSTHFSVTPIGDVDGDGCSDIAIGTVVRIFDPPFWVTDPGQVLVASGQTGTVLATFGGGLGSLFGDSLCAVGDIDGDDVPDVLVHAPLGPAWNMSNSLGSQGETWMISGATLQAGLVHECSATDYCDVQMRCVGDVDGDGFRDYWAGRMMSGRTFARIPFPGAIVHEMAFIGDINGDGVGEFSLGAGVLSLLGDSYSIFGHLHASLSDPTTPKIGISGRAKAGRAVTVNASNVADGVPAFLMIGTSNTNWGGRDLPFSVSMFGLGGCDVLISPDLIVPTFTTSIGTKAYASLTFPIPNVPSLTGITRYAQWYVTTGGNGPGALSAAVSITFE